MGIKNTVFFLDLKTLSSKPDSKLKAFAKSEDLEVEDIIKIIYAEAERIKEEDKVKVTFKIIDDDEDSFRVIVESANVKYKGTIIYPYEKIKSDDFEFVLDSVCGTITLVNKKADCKKISVTIDGAALDIFSMKYKEAKDFLKELSDRKGKKGYIEYPDGICFKHFGIKLNAQKAENGDVLVDSKVASINVYNQEEFDKAFYFEPEKQEKYDVNIPLPDEYNYEKKDNKKKKSIVVEKEEVKEVEEPKIEIELPEEKSKEELEKEAQQKREKEDREREEQRKKNQEELDLIRKRQEEELEKVKEKFRRELEEDINKNIQKYEEEKLEKVELPESIKEEKKEEKVEEPKDETPQITGPIIVNPITPKVEKVEDILEDDEENEEEIVEEIPHKDGFAELQKKFKILTDELDEEDEDNTQEDFEDEEIEQEEIEQIEPQTIKQPEEDFDIKDLDEVLGRKRKEEPKEENDNDNEIEVLEKMLEEGKRQQEILEQRITAKLEELKAQVKAKEEPKKEEIKQEVKEEKEIKKTTKKETSKASLQDLEKEIEELEEEIVEPKAAPKKETKKTVKKEEKVEESENTVRSYTLESYKGLIDNSTNTLIVYFGQSKKDIRKILGKPKQIRDFEEMEMYEDFYVYYDEEDKCVGIGLYNDKKYETTLSLSMFDRNLIDMKYRHIVKLIKRNDPNSIEDDDGIISLKYGISVDPREEKDSADDICDVIHIFQKGYYDEVYENF